MKREQKCHIYSHSEKSKQHKRLFAYCLLAFLLLNITLNAAAQDANAIRDLVAPYFTSYTNNEYTSNDKIRVDSVKIIPEEKWLGIYVNEGFVSQPFRPEMVKKIYAEVNNLLQEPYNKYKLTIFALEYPIEVLIPSNFTKQENRDWNKQSWEILCLQEEHVDMATSSSLLHHGGFVHSNNRSALSFSHAGKCRSCGILAT